LKRLGRQAHDHHRVEPVVGLARDEALDARIDPARRLNRHRLHVRQFADKAVDIGLGLRRNRSNHADPNLYRFRMRARRCRGHQNCRAEQHCRNFSHLA
jgi:hypothetical protein